MIARNRNRPTMTIVAAMVVIALATNAVAGQPNYPPEPTVTEYTVDPAWPKRPAEFGPGPLCHRSPSTTRTGSGAWNAAKCLCRCIRAKAIR